ncbi:MAG: potassium transporter Kup [Candidatus Hydrogenedentes bacterium]|nr:potassium transporter Kup [Candidatus Hydrogenedentota bacterium]
MSHETNQTDHKKQSVAALTLGALGVVYGDIGTSPLYTMRECLGGEHGAGVNHDNVLGILSLIFWALIAIISIKYVRFVLRADNRGEGGILALMSLVTLTHRNKRDGLARVLIALGIFGAALLYGDGMITPAITVLGAVEGLSVATEFFNPYIVPIVLVILFGLFLIQKWGTARLGAYFGPIICIWFVAIGALGVRAIVQHPHVLHAVNPWYALSFLLTHGLLGFALLGSVFLAVTGGESLYADIGHFGRIPIRNGWFMVALPCLLMNYFGQGAVLLFDETAIANPFYALTPKPLLLPMVVLATMAACIASQAVITGAFSISRQAVQLGFLPRLRILHTSSHTIGQIYVPAVNTMLMLATFGLVVGFGTSSNLSAAYGVAVSTTMLITSTMLAVFMREAWKWPWYRIAMTAGVFLVIDLIFWSSTMLKVPHGGWFPLLAGLVLFLVMTTWKKGRGLLYDRLRKRTLSLQNFVESVFEHGSKPKRVPGAAVFLSGTPSVVPVVLLHNLKYNKVLHEKTIVLSFVFEETSHVPEDERVEVADLGHGFFNVIAHYGFMESPHILDIIDRASEKGLQFERRTTGFYLGRESIVVGKSKGMAKWRTQLFATMSRLATGATSYFGIPPNQVVELGVQIEM